MSPNTCHLVREIIEFITQPFPSSSDPWDQVKEAASVGLLIFVILFFLQPFGTSNIPTYEALRITLSFGVLTFVVCISYNLFLIKVLGFQYDKPTWTFIKWIISTLILILFISVANFLFMSFQLGFLGFGWKQFLYQVYMTFVIGIFPLVFFGTITMLRKDRYFNKVAKDLTHHQHEEIEALTINILIDSQEASLELSVEDILYVEAMQNYATVYLAEGRSEVIRATLKSLENQLSEHGIIRTHRSYLVNKRNIEKVSGNAQGLKLSLSHSDAIVPVSRSYIPAVRTAI